MSKRELPGITPFRFHEYFISLFVRKWEYIWLDGFCEVEKILRSVVEELSAKRVSKASSLFPFRRPSTPIGGLAMRIAKSSRPCGACMEFLFSATIRLYASSLFPSEILYEILIPAAGSNPHRATIRLYG
jgi:hypothetical protein